MQLHKTARKLLERDVQDKLVAEKKKKKEENNTIDMRPFLWRKEVNKNIYSYMTVFA